MMSYNQKTKNYKKCQKNMISKNGPGDRPNSSRCPSGPKKIRVQKKIIFFILVGGAPGTIWDHIKPKNGPKKVPKNGQKRAKIGQDRPKIGPR